MASKDRGEVEPYTRLEAGALRALAQICKEAAVFVCLIRYQGKDSTSGRLCGRVYEEDSRFAVCMPASSIARETGMSEASVYQALHRLKRKQIEIACDNEEGYELRPAIETIEGESGRRGSAAVYRVNALNLPLSETNLFIPELSVERESVTPIAVAKANNAVAKAKNSYTDSNSLIDSTYRTDSTYKTTDMRNSAFGFGEQTLYEVDRTMFHAECPQCGSRFVARFNNDGRPFGTCSKCMEEVTVSLPDNRATAKNGDGNYVLIDTGAIERPSDSRVHGE